MDELHDNFINLSTITIWDCVKRLSNGVNSSFGLASDEFCRGVILQVQSQISPRFPFINQHHCPDSFDHSDNLKMRLCLMKK